MADSSFTPWSRLVGGESPPPSAHPVRSVCVIGAGSSGLVAARHLAAAGFEVSVYEKDNFIGGTFVTKAYDDAGLVSSKFLTAFSDLRSPESDPPHLSLAQYVEYLKKYADTHQLWRHITFGAQVASVERVDGGGYSVRLEPVAAKATAKTAKIRDAPSKSRQAARLRTAATLRFDAVCVCSGLHEAPYVPPIPGLEGFTGERLLHSAEYTDKETVFAGRRVLVIGCGETGMDLAYRAVQVADQTALSIKKGFLSVPYEGWGGVPLDTLITNIFEHAYEHRWAHATHLKWKFTTVLIRIAFFVMTGSTEGYNQWVGGLTGQVKRGYHILCKSTAAMPYLNRPFKQKGWWYSWLWNWSEPSVDKSIHAHGAPARVDGRTVTFADGRTFDADVIALATGYRQTFPFLHATGKAAGAGRAAENGSGGGDGWKICTGARGPEDPLPPEHFIVSPTEPGLAFIGFVRPNVGAIPPMAELQVMWWIERLRGRTKPALAPPSYMLLGGKLTYGVDYGNYMHQLAAEIGAAPTVTMLLRRSPKAFLAWALGQAYIPFFRLRGPFASEDCWRLAETELLSPVLRRGSLANLMLVLVVLLFGYVSLLCYALELAARLGSRLLGLLWISRAVSDRAGPRRTHRGDGELLGDSSRARRLARSPPRTRPRPNGP